MEPKSNAFSTREVRANQETQVSLQVDAGQESLKDAVAMISVVDKKDFCL